MKKLLKTVRSNENYHAQKILLVMKLATLLICLNLIQISAKTFSQDELFTLKTDKIQIRDLLDKIESETNYKFLYGTDYITTSPIKLDVKNASLETLLSTAMDKSDMTYKILDDNLVVVLSKEYATAMQQREITGTVVDEATNEPLPGVNIIIQGTSTGVITDINGKYTIKVPDEEAVLVFSFLGYVDQKVSTINQTTIDIKLSPDVTKLDEVVVIGYGKVKKVDVTGSVASVGSEELEAYPVSNVAQALQGKIPGVTITSVDGRPDATTSVRIRGGGSITQNNDPLFIVDGFPVSNINDIPASQIESINILKDASSTAIYGARGSNGVVIITTKSSSSDRISVTYDGSFQIKNPSNYLGVLDPYEFAMINWEFGTLFGYGDAWEMAYGLGSNYSSLNSGGINSYRDIKTRDIQKEVIGTAYAQNHNISITGGSSKSKYSISLDHLDDNGLKIQSWYKRTSVLGKLQTELAKGLVLDLDIRYSGQTVFGNEKQTNTSGSKLTESLRFTPVTPLGDISSNNSQIGMYDTYIREIYDPIDVINDIYDKTERQKFRSNAALSWTITDGLVFRSEYGLSKSYSTQYYYNGPVSKSTVGVEGGDAKLTKKNSTSYRFLNTLNYELKGLGENHHFNLLVGQEINGKDSEETKLTGTRYPISFDHNKVFAMMNQYGDQGEIELSNTFSEPGRMASFFGRVNYSFKERYLFTATLRADGSSNFAPSNRWGYFPAAATAWRISEEPFMKDLSAISNLKLRLSYGQAGNDQITSGLWKMDWAAKSDGYSYDNVGNPYYVPSSKLLSNPELKWETTITRNLGIDFGLFRSRLYGSVDAYWNTTKDLLMVNQIPAYTGYTTQMANVGQTRNTGLEFSMGGNIVHTENLDVSANFNISINRNKINELSQEMEYYYYTSNWGSSSTRPTRGDYAFMVGHPVGLIRGYVNDGFYTTDDFDYDATSQTYTLKDGIADSRSILGVFPGINTGVYPGMLKLKKINTQNDAIEVNESDDATIIGNVNPKHTGGFNVNATYKHVDMMVGFNWSYGNDIYNVHKLSNSYGNKLPFRNFSDAVSGWYSIFEVNNSGNLVRVYDPAELDANNVNATGPMPFHESAVVHSGGIEDGSFLRLNNVTLGYTLPKNLTQKVFIKELRIYATIYNAWLWTKYTGYDPEIDAGNGRNKTYPTPGMDFGAYPRARTYTFGVNVNF
jgi:TonB-dependent starch-binding outer membrane protein SusC